MLYWIWFVGLTALGWFFFWLGTRNASFKLVISSMYSLMISLILSYPVLIVPFYEFLAGVLPNQGEDINQITTVAIIGILSVGWVALPAIVGLVKGIAENNRDERQKAATGE